MRSVTDMSRSNRRAKSSRATNGKKYIVGVDIGGSNLRVALADARGNILAKWKTSTRATSSPEMVVAQIEQGIDHLLKEVSSSRRSLMAIAAGAPGVTDVQAGVVRATSYLKGWVNVPFQNLLQSALNVPAAIENDVRMAALGEHWMGAARGVDDFVFLAIGTGIAAGIFSDGKLVRGHNSTAGEIGYMYVPGGTKEPAKSNEPGSLEGTIGGDGIRQQWEKLSEGTAASNSATATELFERAASGDRLANQILDHSAQLLAYAVYNISLVLDSSVFVLGGGVGMSAVLRQATERVLERYSEPVHPRLITSSLGPDAQIMGAIRLALDTANAHKKTEL